MDLQSLEGLVPLVTIITALLAGLSWIIRAQIRLQKEFRPNHGSSARDTLNEIRADVREIRGKVDDHIEWHMDN
jgi:acetylornithine deacetylase/succinyl-diaminopimelate desuccinylase-like protein